MELYLDKTQTIALIKQAERDEEVIVIRCLRKTPASKLGGPNAGELQDIHCGTKPSGYVARGVRSRPAEDAANGVLTVFATNRKDKTTDQWGAFRRINVTAVKKVIYRGQEWEVTHSF